MVFFFCCLFVCYVTYRCVLVAYTFYFTYSLIFYFIFYKKSELESYKLWISTSFLIAKNLEKNVLPNTTLFFSLVVTSCHIDIPFIKSNNIEYFFCIVNHLKFGINIYPINFQSLEILVTILPSAPAQR